MRLPRWMRRRDRRIHLDLHPMEATEARIEAEQQWAKVHQITEAHRELRRRNHFAPTVERALGGRS